MGVRHRWDWRGGGVVGTWRAVAVDRRTKALQLLWIAKHHEEAAWEVRSNLPRTAYNVRFAPEGRFRVAVTDRPDEPVVAGDFRILLMTVPVTIAANAVVVTWETRLFSFRRRHSFRVLLPPRSS